MMFRARLADLDFGPGPESLEVRLFDEDEVPWEELAFRTITRTLRNYFLDRKRRQLPGARQHAGAQAAAAGSERGSLIASPTCSRSRSTRLRSASPASA